MSSHDQSQQPPPDPPPDLLLGPYTQYAPIPQAGAGPTIIGDISSKRDTIIGTNVYISYTGPSPTPDQRLSDEQRRALEQAYRSEVAWRYDAWRRRYAPLAIQARVRSQALPPVRLFEREELRFQAFQRSAPDLHPAGAGEGMPETSTYTFTDLRDELKRHNHILLLGPPGGGKTTALWRLALDLAEDGLYRNAAAPLPVFVRLGGLVPGQELTALLRNELEQAVVLDAEQNEFALKAHRMLAPLLDQLLAEGRLVLLWDGLNETLQEIFGATAQAIDVFRRKNPGPPSGPRNQSLVTCRSNDYALLSEQLTANPLPQYQQATIQELDAETVKRVIIGQLEEHGQALIAALAAPEQRTLAELARTPLLLSMLCWIYARDQRLPATRGKLLQTFTAMRWAWEAEVQKDRWIDADIQRRALAALGYAITEGKGRGTSVPWVWAQAQLAPHLGSIAPARIRSLAQRADLIELLDGGRALRFSHQLIQEYFAALMLQQKLAEAVCLRQSWFFGSWRAAQALQQYAAPGKRTGWEETLLLLAGIEDEHGPCA